MFLLHELVRTRNNMERLVELLENGANPNSGDDSGNSTLHIVASKEEVSPQDLEENVELAKVLVKFGADLDLRNNTQKTPLILAIESRNCRMTRFLLSSNAQIDLTDNDGNTALHHATLQCGSSFQNEDEFIHDPVLELIRALLDSNPNIDARNNFLQTPLMLAVKNQDLQVVKELLDKYSSLDLVDEDNNTALHYAFDREHVDLDIVLELVRRGCTFNIRNLMDMEPISVYINKLFGAPAEELENAKSVFKYCLLRHEFYGVVERKAIQRLSRRRNCQLFQFLEKCTNEVERMKRDNLVGHYSVYMIANRGLNGIKDNKSEIPVEVFESVLEKLMESEYPVYRDVIASGIHDEFMKKTFAATVCFVGNTRSDYELFYVISKYLSWHMDMLNFMLACSLDERNKGPFSFFSQCFKSCSEE